MKRLMFCIGMAAICWSCAPTPDVSTAEAPPEASTTETPTETPTSSASSLRALGGYFQDFVDEHEPATAGAALIRGGKVVWTGTVGERVPGEPASSETMLNTGSITKTIAAEVVLRLADQGVLSLDEPMAPHWIDPDLVDDPRSQALTPRMALTHKTGFPNWRYMDPEFKLRFQHEPGTAFGYSGEGYEYVARFAEAKTGESFTDLAERLVFKPLELNSMAVAPEDWVLERIVHPVDATGERRRPFCTGPDERRCAPNGEWSAADELATTVLDYAAFMIAVMNGEGVGEELQADRLTIQTSTAEDEILGCSPADDERCPTAQGYGLGWEIFEFDDAKIVSHGGSDWSERAIAYFDAETHDGLVLFLNAPAETSTEALIDGMNALDPGSKVAMLYRRWVDAYQKKLEADS